MALHMHRKLEPKLLTILRGGYSRKQFFADVNAGVIVGIIALPLAIAFAIASGVKPEQGLYTAIIAGALIAALGGSRVQIGGPTGAFIVIVYGIVQQYGYDGLVVVTIIAGVLLILMGLFRMGAFLKFIPYPVTVGFTSGIALIIFSAEMGDLFGLRVANLPADTFSKWEVYAGHLGDIQLESAGIAALSLLVIIFWKKISYRIPGPLVAILVSTALVQFLHLNVETIGSRFGSVPTHLPMPVVPHVTWSLVIHVFSPAVTVALLAAIESLLSATVADGMIGSRHRSNMELIALGVANIVTPLFGGIPATGAIARTATNIKNGGRTPVAGIVHAVTLLLIMLFFGQWAALIPMPTLAAILVIVAYNMSEWRTFAKMLRGLKMDIAVLLSTFFLTVAIDLTVAIEVGVVLSAFLFLKRMMDVSQSQLITAELRDTDDDPDDKVRAEGKYSIPDGVEIFEIHGALFFAAVDQFKNNIASVEKAPKVLVLQMHEVFAIDTTGMHALEELFEHTELTGTTLILDGIHAQPLNALLRTGILDRVGMDNVCGNLDESLARARVIVEGESNPTL